ASSFLAEGALGGRGVVPTMAAMADPHSITLPAPGGGSLLVQQWEARAECHSNPRGAVVLVHGIGRHSGLFPRLVQGLTNHGYTVLGLDLPGHGRSSGQRGHILHWSEFRLAVAAVLDQVERQLPQSPRFLVGHSLGGTVVLDAALHLPGRLQGTVAANPALGASAVHPLRLLLARLLSPLWPAFSLSTGIPLALSSRDPEVLARAEHDPLRHGRASVRLASEYLRTTAWLRRHAADFRGPLLLLCSGDDRVVSTEASQAFFAAAASSDKTWRTYPDSYHDLFEDLDHQQVISDLLGWLDAHSGISAREASS
ncbi:MAG: alpha/beta hydrolase, partial [Prochlorococcaceae cyanobacterium]